MNSGIHALSDEDMAASIALVKEFRKNHGNIDELMAKLFPTQGQLFEIDCYVGDALAKMNEFQIIKELQLKNGGTLFEELWPHVQVHKKNNKSFVISCYSQDIRQSFNGRTIRFGPKEINISAHSPFSKLYYIEFTKLNDPYIRNQLFRHFLEVIPTTCAAYNPTQPNTVSLARYRIVFDSSTVPPELAPNGCDPVREVTIPDLDGKMVTLIFQHKIKAFNQSIPPSVKARQELYKQQNEKKKATAQTTSRAPANSVVDLSDEPSGKLPSDQAPSVPYPTHLPAKTKLTSMAEPVSQEEKETIRKRIEASRAKVQATAPPAPNSTGSIPAYDTPLPPSSDMEFENSTPQPHEDETMADFTPVSNIKRPRDIPAELQEPYSLEGAVIVYQNEDTMDSTAEPDTPSSPPRKQQKKSFISPNQYELLQYEDDTLTTEDIWIPSISVWETSNPKPKAKKVSKTQRERNLSMQTTTLHSFNSKKRQTYSRLRKVMQEDRILTSAILNDPVNGHSFDSLTSARAIERRCLAESPSHEPTLEVVARTLLPNSTLSNKASATAILEELVPLSMHRGDIKAIAAIDLYLQTHANKLYFDKVALTQLIASPVSTWNNENYLTDETILRLVITKPFQDLMQQTKSTNITDANTILLTLLNETAIEDLSFTETQGLLVSRL